MSNTFTQEASYVFSFYSDLISRIEAGEWSTPEALAEWMYRETEDYTTDPDEGSQPVEVTGIEEYACARWLQYAPGREERFAAWAREMIAAAAQ